MITFKNKLKSNYTQVPNQIIYNSDLSWKAKGIFSYLCSRPSDWEFYMTEIVKNASDGETALKSGIKELEDAGWLTRRRKHDDDGSFSGMEWIISFPDHEQETPSVGNHHQWENPTDGKSTTTNTDSTNTDKNTKTNSNIPDLEDVVSYFMDNGYSKDAAHTFYEYYQTSVEDTQRQYWRDSRGNKIKNWKMKAQAVWFKDENKIENQQTSMYSAFS